MARMTFTITRKILQMIPTIPLTIPHRVRDAGESSFPMPGTVHFNNKLVNMFTAPFVFAKR